MLKLQCFNSIVNWYSASLLLINHVSFSMTLLEQRRLFMNEGINPFGRISDNEEFNRVEIPVVEYHYIYPFHRAPGGWHPLHDQGTHQVQQPFAWFKRGPLTMGDSTLWNMHTLRHAYKPEIRRSSREASEKGRDGLDDVLSLVEKARNEADQFSNTLLLKLKAINEKSIKQGIGTGKMQNLNNKAQDASLKKFRRKRDKDTKHDENYGKGKDKGNEFQRKAEKISEETCDKHKQKGCEKKRKGKKAYDNSKENSSENFDKVKRKGSDINGKAKDKGSEVKEKGSNYNDKVKEKRYKSFGKCKRKSRDTCDDSKEKNIRFSDKAKEKGSEISDKSEGKGSEFSDKAKGKGIEFSDKGKGSEFPDKGKKKGKNNARGIQLADKSISEQFEDAKGKVSQYFNDAKKNVKNFYDETQKTADELKGYYDTVKEKSVEYYDEAKKFENKADEVWNAIKKSTAWK